jgi:hypothetical protein
MTTKLVAVIQRFQGLSTDDKPCNPPEGSTFHAIDTGQEWIFYDGGWELDQRLISAIRMASV